MHIVTCWLPFHTSVYSTFVLRLPQKVKMLEHWTLYTVYARMWKCAPTFVGICMDAAKLKKNVALQSQQWIKYLVLTCGGHSSNVDVFKHNPLFAVNGITH